MAKAPTLGRPQVAGPGSILMGTLSHSVLWRDNCYWRCLKNQRTKPFGPTGACLAHLIQIKWSWIDHFSSGFQGRDYVGRVSLKKGFVNTFFLLGFIRPGPASMTVSCSVTGRERQEFSVLSWPGDAAPLNHPFPPAIPLPLYACQVTSNKYQRFYWLDPSLTGTGWKKLDEIEKGQRREEFFLLWFGILVWYLVLYI